jgi:hypothetical protein
MKNLSSQSRAKRYVYAVAPAHCDIAVAGIEEKGKSQRSGLRFGDL